MNCGASTEVHSISEVERCVYSAVMSSPAACSYKYADAKKDFDIQQAGAKQLAGDESSSKDSDEL